MRDIIEMTVIFVVLFSVCFGVIAGICAIFEVGQCNTLTKLDDNHNYQWVFWGGCLVQADDGRWVDVDNYYQIEEK